MTINRNGRIEQMEETDSRRIRIKADRELEDLIPGFLENRRKDIESIRLHLVSGDYDAAERLGHSMKGSGGGYGFEEITSIGLLIERFAKEKNSDAITKQLESLADYLDRVEVFYE